MKTSAVLFGILGVVGLAASAVASCPASQAAKACGDSATDSQTRVTLASYSAEQGAKSGSYGAKADIVDTAVGAGQFNTLAAALKAAGLIETLKGPGPFTVFAPTDEAFAKLPAGTVENLLKPENRETLKGILLYHVVPGRAFSEDVVTLREAKTLQGSSVTVSTTGGVRVDNAKVIKTDINARNGVIHVIDSVILPK